MPGQFVVARRDVATEAQERVGTDPGHLEWSPMPELPDIVVYIECLELEGRLAARGKD